MGHTGFSALKNLSFLQYRHRAEAQALGLPGLIAAAEKAARAVHAGEHARHASGMGEKFWQFREYDVSDRPQDIDWRQSARGDRLYVREREWQTAQSVLIWCAAGPGMDYASDRALPSKKDCALTLSLALGILLTRAGELVGALEGGAAAGRSDRAIQELGETLLQGGKDVLPPGAPGRRIPARSSLILVGDFLSPAERIAQRFDELSARFEHAALIQILDPAERDLPFEGRVILESPDGARIPVENAESVRAAYRRRIGDHIDALAGDCRRRGWPCLLHTTGGDMRDTLLAAWRMIAPESWHAGGAR